MYHQDKKGFYKKHDNVDFELIIIIIIIIIITSDIEPISIAVEEKGYDSEVKHVLVKVIKTYSIIHILDRSMLLY